MTPLLLAVVLAVTDRGVLVAHDGSIEMFDRTATTRIWSAEGLPTPGRIVTSNQQAVIIDPLASQIRMIDLASGRGTTLRTGETPIDGTFLNGRLYLLERDARALERIGTDGARASIPLAADPAFLRQAGERIYVYSRIAGVLQEITTAPFELRRTAEVAPFASDLELDTKNAYLTYPRGGKIRIVSLATMKNSGSFDVGAVPVEAAFASSGTALTARTLAVADPSAKRVWMVQGAESFAQAFARGFLRGLIGLGLYGGGASQFPTGVDRIIIRGSQSYAYDSSSGTLYRFTKSASSVVAKNIAPEGFAVGAGGLYVWEDAVRRLQRLDGND
ncbi:MAG TPA: hypothetical protein VGA10_10665 [Thermoanaerobaculia bacterium]